MTGVRDLNREMVPDGIGWVILTILVCCGGLLLRLLFTVSIILCKNKGCQKIRRKIDMIMTSTRGGSSSRTRLFPPLSFYPLACIRVRVCRLLGLQIEILPERKNMNELFMFNLGLRYVSQYIDLPSVCFFHELTLETVLSQTKIDLGSLWSLDSQLSESF